MFKLHYVLQVTLLLSLAAHIRSNPPATPCDDPKAPNGIWQEGCLVQTCKAGTVVKSLAEECIKLIEKSIQDVLDEKRAEKDLLYFGDTIVELPSFEPFTKCKVAPHPVKDLGVAVTGLLDGKVITCGGKEGTKWPKPFLSTCHKLEGGIWSNLPNMKENRARAAASVTNNGALIVTGGQNMDYSALNSTEIFKNGAWEYGPQLPMSMASHCQLTTKSGVIVSGLDRYGSSNFYVFRLEGGEWKKLKEEKWRLPKTFQSFGHSCQMLPNNRLAVLGSHGDSSTDARLRQRIFNILDLNTLKWSEGPHLPFELEEDFSIIYKDTLYIIHQDSGDVYGLPTNLDGDWVKIKNIGRLAWREVFPAPIVQQKNIC